MTGVPATLPRTTRVVACAGGDHTRIEERPCPVPGPGEMLLRLRVVGLCGTDLFKLDTGIATPGLVLGHELVGDVMHADGEAAFVPGDRVVVPHHVPCGRCHLCRAGSETMCPDFRENLLAPGGFSELVLVRGRATAHAARRVPDHVSDESAVFMEPAACVLRGVERSGLGEDGSAVVLGAGSMGLLHLLVLRAARPGVAVLVVDPDEARRRHAQRLGAAATAPPGAATLDAARALAGGIGCDAVFDTVGGAGPLAEGLGLTRAGGTVVLFAHAPAGQAADFDLNELFKHERRVIGTYSGSLREQREVMDMIVDGRLDASPLATHRLPLGRFDEGVRLVRARQALKVLYTPSG